MVRYAVASLPDNFRDIRKLAGAKSHVITLGHLMRSTTRDSDALIRQGRWLHKQLPIRFARRLDDFFQLPHIAVMNPCFNEVMTIYLDTFQAVLKFPSIRTAEDEALFCELVTERFEKHQPVAELVAQGYKDIRRLYPEIRLDDFLETLFVARISTRILTQNYLEMRKPKRGFVGVVKQDLRPAQVLHTLTPILSRITRRAYGFSPEVDLRGNLNASLEYIPQHVQFMVRELLKNALRSTAERHQERRHLDGIPPVVVELQKGDFHVIIKISDQGGGMTKGVQKEAWQFGWTSVPDGDCDSDMRPMTPTEVVGRPPDSDKELAGFGFGLPLTKILAQFFGGDVFMQALPGHGTDMYLLLNHLREGSHATEGDDPSTSLVSQENYRGDSRTNAP